MTWGLLAFRLFLEILGSAHLLGPRLSAPVTRLKASITNGICNCAETVFYNPNTEVLFVSLTSEISQLDHTTEF